MSTPLLHPLCKKKWPPKPVFQGLKRIKLQRKVKEVTLSSASSLQLLEQTVTGHLWNMPDYVIDGGVHVLGRLETRQGSARCLRGGRHTGKLKVNSAQSASGQKHANPVGAQRGLHVLYLRRLHFPRDGDKLVNAKVFGCIFVACRGTVSVQQAAQCSTTKAASRGNRRVIVNMPEICSINVKPKAL